MKHRYLFLFFILMLPSAGFTQVSLVKSSSWSVKGGTDISFPLIGRYYDFSVVKGADYFWEYEVRPGAAFGYYAELAKVKELRSKQVTGFITYGLAYRQSVRSLEYKGWEGGGFSGVYNQGSGSKQWTRHYATMQFKATQQFYLGLRKRIVLNSLGFSAGFLVYKQEKREFAGSSTYTDGTVLINALGYNTRGVNNDFYIPQLHLNYEFGYVIPVKNSIIIPHITTPLLNFNNYLQKYEPRNTPLKLRKEYYKDFAVGITFMPVSAK